LANQVGGLYEDGKLDYISHKLSHALIGGVEGAILGDMKAGAAAAVIAETLAEALTPKDLLLCDNPLQTLQNIADISKVMTASILLALGEKDMEVVIATATNAVENNFLVSKVPLIGPLFRLLKGDDDSSDMEALKQFLLRYTGIDLEGDVTDEAIKKYWGGKIEEFKQLPAELKQLAVFIAQDPIKAGQVFKELGMQKLAEFSDLMAHDPETAMDDMLVEGAKFIALTKGLSTLSKAIRGTKVVEEGAKIVVEDSLPIGKAVEIGEDVWTKGPVVRGEIIEKELGQNLHQNFPTVDRFKDGIVTSIKSLDLSAPTYQRPTTLSRILRGYVDKVAGFEKGTLGKDVIKSSEVTGRALDLAIPSGASSTQQAILKEIISYGQSKNVAVNIKVIQ
jgi:hypothetical protein